MDQFSSDFGRLAGQGPQLSDLPATQEAQGPEATTKMARLKERATLNKGQASSGLVDKTSKLSSQERLAMQARMLGKSAVVSLTAINIALFTPIEFSFGKMTALTLNAMVLCLDRVREQERQMKKLKGKTDKKAGLKRLQAGAKKAGAIVGFAAMAVLMGGFGSIAAGSAFTIRNSLVAQDGGEDQ